MNLHAFNQSSYLLTCVRIMMQWRGWNVGLTCV